VKADKDLCPICLEEVKGKGLKCGHKLHAKCMNQLKAAGHEKCPMCRRKMEKRSVSRSRKSKSPRSRSRSKKNEM